MKRLKKVLLLTLTLFMLVSPILNVYSVSTNERQIVSSGGETTQDGVTVSKMISPSSLENYFDITLKVKTQEIASNEDIAIVIVMDISNTMVTEKDNDGNSRLRAAMNAGEEFIKEFANYSSKSSANMKLGYVAFNTDGHELFKLQDCKDSTTANKLIDDMKNKTKKEVIDIDNKNTIYDKELYHKYTNIEAGLKMAEDMLYSNETKNIQNKFIILLSDGLPTTYLDYNQTGYQGYHNRMEGVNANISNHYLDGIFYDDVSNKPLLYGADYSEKGAIRAENAATRIKNRGTIIYSVGTGITETSDTVNTYVKKHESDNYSTVDRTSDNYKVGKTYTDFKKWLGGNDGNYKNIGVGIGSGYTNYYFDANDTQSLENAYSNIFKTIKAASEASWVTKDPMNAIQDDALKDIIGFVGIYDKNNNLHDSVTKGTNSENTASFNATTDSITWDLKNSNYKTTTETVNGTNVSYYEYELKYRVRLETETKTFVKEKVYNTNGVTKLSYIYRVTGQTPQTREIEFKIPSVKGYLGSLEFTKKSSYDGNVLSGTTFEIVHASDCECLDERSHMASDYKITAVSDESGKVSFKSIPSGHKYVLHEVGTDSYHELDTTNYNFDVSYGVTSLSLVNNEFINTVKTNKLTLEKIVEGNNTKKEFTFELVGVYKDSDLNGTFKATLNGEDTTVTFTDGKTEVKLKNKDKIVIDIPYNAIINVEEVNSNGYIVKYKLNDNEFIYGSILDNVKIDGDVSINFTNVSSYKLPATGSSWNLILVIIGTALLVIPVIYIIKNSFKKADK